MNYRIRNLRTGETVESPDVVILSDVPEWVLEFSAPEKYDEAGAPYVEWVLSSYHTKDITGVQDPRSLSELVPVFRTLGVS